MLPERKSEYPDGVIREVLYPVVSEKMLRDLVREYKASGTAFRQQVHVFIRASYKSHYRRTLPQSLEVLEYRCNKELPPPEGASRFASVGLLLVMHGSPSQQLVAALTVGMREVHLVRPKCLLDRL